MSIVKAKTNQYGPATLDVQVEQVADFKLSMELTKLVNNAPVPWDLTGATFDVHMSTQWSPGQTCIPWRVVVVDAPTGKIRVEYLASEQAALVSLPSPPRKTVTPTPFQMGDWIFNITQAAETIRLFQGRVLLARDPCLS